MSEQWAAPDWQRWNTVAVQSRPAPPLAETWVDWRSETVVAVLVAAYSAVLGAVAGLLWSRFSPKIYLPKSAPRLTDAVNGSEAASKVLLGDDMWLALFALLAGVVAVAILLLVAREHGDGPGGMIGLAVGGILGTLVAAHLGHRIQQPHLVASLKHAFPGITPSGVKTLLGYFGFTLRIKSLLLVWPIVAIVLNAAVIGLRYLRERTAHG